MARNASIGPAVKTISPTSKGATNRYPSMDSRLLMRLVECFLVMAVSQFVSWSVQVPELRQEVAVGKEELANHCFDLRE